MTKIKCEICGAEVHSIKSHLDAEHQGTDVASYKASYPDAPLLSEPAKQKLMEIQRNKSNQEKMMGGELKKPLHEVFGIPSKTKGAMNASGGPIPIMVMGDSENEFIKSLVPDVDDNYIFNIDDLKTAVMGIECSIPTFIYGHAGTGKTTLFRQICARTNRPSLRVQHSGNTEESHIVGQYVVKDGATVWEPGPLQICMKEGITYLADEYDRGLPQVLSVYQPVLEPDGVLVTKEAPPEWRIIKPHPDFRFIATGNTNGSGDEIGLFPSTSLQDFANFERFGIMIKVGWMPEKQETAVVQGQAGIPTEDARQLVKFACEVRKQVDSGNITAPISPRALINAGMIGIRFKDYAKALELAYINRLCEADAEACRQVAQRFFS